jgi:hypothetical protein
MADTVTTTTIQDGPRNVTMHFTNVSDGTGESLVTKVDASALSGAPTKLSIQQVWYNLSGMDVDLFFVGTSDTLGLTFSSTDSGHLDFRSFGGIPATGANPTGDIKFSTRNAALGDAYSITLSLKKG